ncbi:MAG: SHOCT domain-containing protein, partial [Actinobacteria bacterium]|nr:SHOCT domain-containing protein [Actinomycetota bacterium]
GTQSEIYWDDAYLGAQVGAVTRGTYTLNIVDPVLFIKGFVPLTYYSYDAQVFDFTDLDNDAASQLFNEVVGSLAAAFSHYTNDPAKGNRIAKIQGDAIGFAQSLSAAVEEGYQWTTSRGLTIAKVAIQAIEYDEDTKALLSDVKKADALGGARGNSFMQQAAARGIQAAGENPSGGGAGMAFLGMGMQSAGGAMGGLQQPAAPPQYPPPAYPPQGYPPQGPPPQGYPPQGPPPQGYPPQDPAAAAAPPAAAPPAEDPVAKLAQYKSMLDQGLISQEDFDAAKAKLLGL